MVALLSALAVGPSSWGCADAQAKDGGAVSSCIALCEARAASSCLGVFESASECIEVCNAYVSVAGSLCQRELRLAYECRLAQPDVCDDTAVCGSESSARGCR